MEQIAGADDPIVSVYIPSRDAEDYFGRSASDRATMGDDIGVLRQQMLGLSRRVEWVNWTPRPDLGYQPPAEPELKAIIPNALADKSLRIEVSTERRFAVRQEDQVLSGSIDRLVVLYDGENPVAADVIDFKTDTVDAKDSSSVDRVVEKYRPQLESYQSAVVKIFGLEPNRVLVRLALVGAGIVRKI